MRSLITIALMMFVAVGVEGQQHAPRDPMVQANATRKLTAHVYAIEDKDTTPGVPNIGFVVGTRAALVIDTGMGERNGRTVLAEVEKIAPGKALYLVTTHVHPEHDLGAGAFPGTTKMIRSEDQIKDIDEFGYQLADVFMKRSAVNAELLKGAKFRKADITFDKEYTLDLGGVTARILAMGPNHTRGDTAVFVPGDSVLFSGDIAMKGMPSFASPYSTVSHWLKSLDVLDALKPKIVVPSHGPIGDATYMANYRVYLTAIRDRAAALKKEGKSQDEAVKTITAEMQGRYPDTGRLAGAVRAAYAEAR
ncbi:MBL fold metallo-hydrolase [Edaphobacter sp. 12200R-103]|uniref:MBL fold metallo-hydrolase n=1 Tax=Edaphobacter sp. 12200R-103 TaxID=2703788 RepID=UPI00138BE9F8|nr:MBL fold metallo-hydrolase [Edaphobacter sp. 12200R-103]QHS52855.1 MBL fold metallo-hydrolase [Edaphobacter sp. 12200R-103]